MPSVQAGLIPAHGFQAGVKKVDFSQPANGSQGEPTPVDLGLTLLTGEMSVSGENVGLFGMVNVRAASFSGADRIEVINPSDHEGALARAVAGQCDSADPQSCLVERSFLDASLSLARNSTLLLYTNHTTLNHTETAPFGMAFLVQPPEDIGGGALGNLSVEQSLLVMGEQLTGAGRLEGSLGNLYAYMPNNASSLTITDALSGDRETYSGSSMFFRIYGNVTYQASAAGFLVPFVDDARATLRPSSSGVAKEQFNLAAINDVLSSFGSSESVVPGDVADSFSDIAPILNGVLFGAAVAPQIEDQSAEDQDLALIRYSEIELAPSGNDGAVVTGRSDFLMMGTSGFYTEKSGTNLGFLRVPVLSWILWLVAIGAIVAGFALKPMVGASQVGAFGAVRLVGLLFHILALALAFILWDLEIKGFLGTSLLTIFFGGGLGNGPVLALTALFELLPLGMAGLLFGLPVRFIVNSGLKLGGLKKAGGIGKGIGNLAVWGLGAPFIPFFLNGFIGPVVEAASKAFGGG